MAGGYLLGVVWGGVASVVIVGSASLLSDVPGQRRPDVPTVEVPAGSEFDQSRRDTAVQVPQSNATSENAGAVQDGGVSRPSAPVPDDLTSLQSADRLPAGLPETGTADSTMSAPQTGDSPQVDQATDAPVGANSQSSLPQVQIAEDDLSISTDPAQPMAPELTAELAAGLPVVDVNGAQDGTEDQSPTVPTAEIGAVVDENQPMQPQQPLMEALVVDTRPAPAAAPTAPSQGRAPDTDSAPVVSVLAPVQTPVQPPVQSDTDSAPAITMPTVTEIAPDIETAPENRPVVLVPVVPADQPAIETAALSKPFQNLAPNVATNRLPSLGGTQESALPATQSEEPQSGANPEDTLPIDRYAVAFENPDKKPLMSIVLIDDGTSHIGLEALAAFPYPISIAVDTAWSGAGDATMAYRKAGFEVLALIDMTSEATATDAETSMAVKLGVIPEAVAVMEGARSGFQGNREVADQVTAIVAASGHGLVLFPKGLNTVQKLAVKAGVPAASVFRDFDAQDQNAKAIRRFLDHAAFKAGQQDSGVIMVGRLRAETISALILWGLQDRANRVALAPVSAVLTAQQ